MLYLSTRKKNTDSEDLISARKLDNIIFEDSYIVTYVFDYLIRNYTEGQLKSIFLNNNVDLSRETDLTKRLKNLILEDGNVLVRRRALPNLQEVLRMLFFYLMNDKIMEYTSISTTYVKLYQEYTAMYGVVLGGIRFWEIARTHDYYQVAEVYSTDFCS